MIATNDKSETSNELNANRHRVVFISGGSSGIGEATAREFAKSGFKVAISGRNKQRLDDVKEELKRLTPIKDDTNLDNRFLALEVDFEDYEQVEPLIGLVVAKFNRLDVLVNNAGYLGRGCDSVEKEFFQDFQKVLQVNLMAATRLSQLAAPHLIKSPRGVLLNVLDRVANPSISYCVSKAGLSMLTKTLANELEGTGVRVVAVAPGPISTRTSPPIDTLASTTSFGRIGDVQEVANVIRFLESEQAGFIHGCTIYINGGSMARIAITTGPYTPKTGVAPQTN